MSEIDPISAVRHPDPYPYYAALAQQDQLQWEEKPGLWLAASPVLVREVLAHPSLRVRPPAEPVPAALAGGSAAQVFAALVRMNDGARHAAPKLVLQRALAALPAAQVAQRSGQVAAALLRERPLHDWVFEAPVSCVASLLGFDAVQLHAVARWMGQFVACLSPLSSPAQVATAHQASVHLLAAMRELVLAAPEGTLAAAVGAEARAAGWEHDAAVLANLVGLLSQTYEATAGLLGNAMIALQRDASGTDPAALVAQVMRCDPPVHNTRRFAFEDCTVGGVQVAQGQGILVLLAAAQCGFGHGVHACPGATLAQQVAAACLGALAGHAVPALTWTYRASLNARIPQFAVKGEQA